jgi:hypothetical protein
MLSRISITSISPIKHGLILHTCVRHNTPPHPHPQIHTEQAAVVSQYGPTFTPEAYAAMTYTMATVKETLRAAQIIGFVPRVATRELQVLLLACCEGIQKRFGRDDIVSGMLAAGEGRYMLMQQHTLQLAMSGLQNTLVSGVLTQ